MDLKRDQTPASLARPTLPGLTATGLSRPGGVLRDLWWGSASSTPLTDVTAGDANTQAVGTDYTGGRLSGPRPDTTKLPVEQPVLVLQPLPPALRRRPRHPPLRELRTGPPATLRPAIQNVLRGRTVVKHAQHSIVEGESRLFHQLIADHSTHQPVRVKPARRSDAQDPTNTPRRPGNGRETGSQTPQKPQIP